MGRSRSAQKHRAQYLPVVARLCSHGGKPVRDHIPGTVLETATEHSKRKTFNKHLKNRAQHISCNLEG